MSADIGSFPLQASVDEHIALRIALRQYLEQSIVLQRPDGETWPVVVRTFPTEPVEVARLPMITFLDSDGEWEAHANTPTIVQGTAWPVDAPVYALAKDAAWTEPLVAQIEGTDEIQIAAVARVFREALCPHATKYGSLILDLGDLYYGRKARYTLDGIQYLDVQDPEDRKKRIRVAHASMTVEVSTVKIVEVATGNAVHYAVSVE